MAIPRLSGSEFNVPGWKNLKTSHLCDTGFIVGSKPFHPIGYGRYSEFDQYFLQFQSVVTLEL